MIFDCATEKKTLSYFEHRILIYYLRSIYVLYTIIHNGLLEGSVSQNFDLGLCYFFIAQKVQNRVKMM